MTDRARVTNLVKATCLLVGATLPAALVSSPRVLARATGWLAVEICVAVAFSLALSLSAQLSVVTRYRKHVETLISRGLELIAALPVILSVAALSAATPTPVPIVVALVIGSLSGLRYLRHAIGAQAIPSRGSAVTRLTWTTPVVLASIPVTIEQLISLEAAVTWLGPVDGGWSGGWGEQLGRHARLGDLAGLCVWTLAAIGLSLALGVAYRFSVLCSPRPVAKTPDPGT